MEKESNKIFVEIGGKTYSYNPNKILGYGATGIVFKGGNEEGQPVAIKVIGNVIKPNFRGPKIVGSTTDKDTKNRYLDRVLKFTNIKENENLVAVYGIGEGKYSVDKEHIFEHEAISCNVIYVALEYVEGKDLHETLMDLGGGVKHGKLDPQKALGIIKDIANGLKTLHAKEFIHRDVKPLNILINPDDRAKLCDYGIIRNFYVNEDNRLTAKHTFMGTFLFSSPEIIKNFNGEKYSIDGRSDIYSLGMTLYKIITGDYIVSGTERALINKISQGCLKINEGTAEDHGMPEDIFQLIKKMCALKPENRHQNVEELIKDIETIEQSLSNNAQTSNPSPNPATVEKQEVGQNNSERAKEEREPGVEQKKTALL